MLAENVAFGIIAAVMCIGAIRVVTVNNVVHAALYLVVVLAGAAAQFVLLGAEFTGVVQVLVYIGAIIVLFLFGTMLTRAPIGRTPDLNNPRLMPALVALLLLGVLVKALDEAWGTQKIAATDPQTTAQVGDSIFQTYVIPFEVVSVLLLAALVGAIVLARRD